MFSQKVVKEPIKFDEFNIIKRVQIQGSELRKAYAEAKIVRVFFPDCKIQTNAFFQYKSMITAVKGARIGTNPSANCSSWASRTWKKPGGSLTSSLRVWFIRAPAKSPDRRGSQGA